MCFHHTLYKEPYCDETGCFNHEESKKYYFEILKIVCIYLKRNNKKGFKYKFDIAKSVSFLNLYSLYFVYLSLIFNVDCMNVLIP